METQTPSPQRSLADTLAFYEHLKELKEACGSNKHGQAIALIIACIAGGVNTRSDILGTLKRQGLNTGHVAILLDEGTGPFPDSHRWFVGDDGRYRLHDGPQTN